MSFSLISGKRTRTLVADAWREDFNRCSMGSEAQMKCPGVRMNSNAIDGSICLIMDYFLNQQAVVSRVSRCDSTIFPQEVVAVDPPLQSIWPSRKNRILECHADSVTIPQEDEYLLNSREFNLQRSCARICVGRRWHYSLLYRQTAHNVQRRIKPVAERCEHISGDRLAFCSCTVP